MFHNTWNSIEFNMYQTVRIYYDCFSVDRLR